MALTDSLSAYWKLDENTGTTTADAAGGGFTATFGAGALAPSWTTGKINSGLSYVGSSNQRISLASSPTGTGSGYTGAMSYAHWFNSSTAGSASANCMVSWGSNSTGNLFSMSLETSGILWLRCSGNTCSFGSGYADGNWHYVVVTKPASGTIADFVTYVDGVSKTISSSGTTVLSWGSVQLPFFGCGIGGSLGYTGKLDEIAVWSRQLSGSEVSQLYNSGSGLQYPFTAPSGKLFRQSDLNGLGSGGPFFNNPLGRSMLGWVPTLKGLLVPDRKLVTA